MRNRCKHSSAIAGAKAGFSASTAYRCEKDPGFQARKRRRANDGGPIRSWLDHMKRRDAAGVSIRRRQASVDEETVPVLHQRMPDEAELRLLASPFAIEPRFGIDRRSMRLIRALLAVEVRLFVASAALGPRCIRSILRLEALYFILETAVEG